MKKIFFLSFLIFYCLPGTSIQAEKKQIDSLETKLLLVDDSTRMLVHDQLANLYFRNHPKKALLSATKAFEIAKNRNNRKQISLALRNMAKANMVLIADYDKALNLALEALKNDESNLLQLSKALTLLTIANIYAEVGNSINTKQNIEEALEIALNQKDQQIEYRVLIEKGRNVLELNEFEEASLAYRKALQVSKLLDDSYLQANAHFHFATFYAKTGNLDLASEHLATAIDQIKNTKHKILLGQLYNLSGDLMVQKGQMGTAYQYHYQAKVLREKEEDYYGLAETHLSMAIAHKQLKDYEKTLDQLSLASSYSERINDKHLIRKIYNEMYMAYGAIGNKAMAREYKEKYGSISELIFSEESEKKLAELEFRHEMEKKDLELNSVEQQNQIQQLELQKERNFNITLAVLSGLIIIFAVFAFKSYKEKQQTTEELERLNEKLADQNQKLKELNDTKNKLFSIIGHDLKGPLNSLTSFSGLLVNHYSALSEAEVKTLASDLDKSVKNLFSLLENLLTWARSQTGNVDIQPEKFNLEEIIKPSLDVLQTTAENKNIQLTYDGESNPAVYGDKNTLTTVVRNLVSNSLKFTPNGGNISVATHEYKDAIEVSVVDTGVGMSEEVQKKIFDVGKKHTTLGTNKEKGTGLGLVLCKEFVEKNGGSISVQSKEGEGTCFRFTIPKG